MRLRVTVGAADPAVSAVGKETFGFHGYLLQADLSWLECPQEKETPSLVVVFNGTLCMCRGLGLCVNYCTLKEILWPRRLRRKALGLLEHIKALVKKKTSDGWLTRQNSAFKGLKQRTLGGMVDPAAF